METNKLKTWLESLTVAEHREAFNRITERFEVDRITVYNWKKPTKKFSTIEKEELNKIAQVVNNTVIFEL